MRLVRSMVVAGAALAAFGLLRVVFNVVGVRVFGPEFLGRINPRLSMAALSAFMVGGPLGAVVSKFGGEWLGAGRRKDAERLIWGTGGVVLAVALLGGAGAVVSWRYEAEGVAGAAYLVGLAAYVWAKSVYFAIGSIRTYVGLELGGVVGFAIVFSLAVHWGCAVLAVWGLTAHLGVFVLGGVAGLWRMMGFRVGEWGKVLTKEVGKYAVAAVCLSLSGLAAYHAVIVISGARLVDVAAVGYLSVLFSALSPLNLVSNAAGTVLLPEFSFLYGAAQWERLRRLLLWGTAGLTGIFFLMGCALTVAAPWVLDRLGVPGDVVWVGTWRVIVLAVCVSNASTAAGHYLNATRFVGIHAAISLLSAVVAIVGGWYWIAWWGVLGAALTRFLAVVPLAIGRTMIAIKGGEVQGSHV